MQHSKTPLSKAVLELVREVKSLALALALALALKAKSLALALKAKSLALALKVKSLLTTLSTSEDQQQLKNENENWNVVKLQVCLIDRRRAAWR